MKKATKLKRKLSINSGLKPLFILSLFFLTALSSAIFAQEFDVSGTVKDEQGVPLPGANVVVKGENIGVITDVNGNFTLHLLKESQIEISFIGYNNQTFYAKNEQHIDVVLEEGTNELEEVVVIGYGEQKVKHATYSIAKVSLSKIEDIPATNLGTLIRDQIPGVNVTGGESRPGEGASIEIRQSFNFAKDGGTSDPLIVIDDVPQVYTNNGFSDMSAFNALDISEVESITVLKDAAAAIYGSRASQGAIIVKTKRGEKGKAKISYSGKFVFNDAVSHSKTMDTYEYGLFTNRFLGATGVSDPAKLFSDEELEQMKSLNHDWLDQGWKPAQNYQHALNVSGGTENVRYFTGGSYVTQNANMGEDDYTRWNFRSGINATLASGLKLDVTISASKTKHVKPYSKTLSQINDNSYGSQARPPDYGILLHMPRYIPWSAEYTDGDEYFVSPALGPAQNSGSADAFRQLPSWNYFAMIESGSLSTTESGSYGANFSLQYDVPFIKGLTFKGTYAANFASSMNEQVQTPYSLIRSSNSHQEGSHLYGDNTNWRAPQVIGMGTDDKGARVAYEDGQDNSYQANAYINYARTIGLHEFGAMASIERAERFSRDSRQLYHDPLDVYGGTSATAGTLYDVHTYIYRYESGNMSYLGRLTYAYADKYLANFILRSDASTKFAPENYWGTFPSASFGWVPSLESFFSDNINWIDFLKIRYSVGLTGKDNIKAWLWRQTFGWDGDKGYKFGAEDGGIFSNALKPGASPNRLVTWDKTLKQNIGIDASVLAGRLSFTYEFWHDKNSEMLMSRANEVGVPISVGGAVAEENFAEVWSWGNEMSIDWRDGMGDFRYRISTNFEFGYNNVIKKYIEEGVGLPADNNKRVGYSNIMPKWGFKVWEGTSTGDGILRTDEDIDNYWAYLTAHAEDAGTNPSYFGTFSAAGLRKGMLAYQDLGGTMNDSTGIQNGPDGRIEEDEDYAKLVKKNQSFGFRTSLQASWKSLSLFAAINASWGTYRQIDVIRQQNTSDYVIWNREPFWTDMYSEGIVFTDENGNETIKYANTDGKYPNIAFDDNRNPSDFWQLPSFRAYIRTLTLAYTLPEQYSNKIGLEKIRFNVTGNNLWDLYNPYPGKYRNIYDASSVGYPTLRTWTLGVNVTF